jgi:N-acetylglutamate synthase-like GNAT family acetyltransferase
VISRARTLGHKRLFLYTEHAQDWYLDKGWSKVRDTVFLGLHHAVMQLDLVI